MPNRTRQLAENALLLGISAVLLFLGTYTIISGFALLAVPVPFVLLALRRNVRDMVFLVLTFAFLGFIVAAIPGAISGFMLAATGAAMGIAYHRKNSALPAIVVGAAIFFASIVVSLIFSTYVLDIDFAKQMEEATNSIVESGFPVPLTPDVSEEEWKQMLQQQIDLLLTLLPFIFVLSSLAMSVIVHWLSRTIGKRLQYSIPALKPFREWSFPRSLLYYYFISLLILLLTGGTMEGSFWGKAIINLKYLLDVAFMIQGLSFCFHLFFVKQWRFAGPVLIVSLFIFTVVPNILILLGIFDLGMNLRQRVK